MDSTKNPDERMKKILEESEHDPFLQGFYADEKEQARRDALRKEYQDDQGKGSAATNVR